MHYMLFIATDSDPDPQDAAGGDPEEWFNSIPPHKYIQGDRLRPVEDAKTVRMRGGELLVTDGPFAESKEKIVGFDIIDCDSHDEAIEIASRHPMARRGRIEVRALWPFDS
jgi:hypothetical protein